MLSVLHKRVLGGLHRRFDSPLFTYEQLRAMFVPLLLDQLFIFGINILSTAMVSSSGEGAISAANYAFVLSSLSYALYSAISVGAGIVISRAKGAGNDRGVREATGQSCTVCTLTGAVMGLAMSYYGTELVTLMYPSIDAAVAEMAGEYLRIFGWSIIPYSLFNMIFTAFRSLGDTKSSLILTVIINSVHLICSFLYINVLKMGVPGAALSYLTARVIGLVFSLYWIMRRKCSIGMRWKDFLHFDRRIFEDIFKLGVPLSLEQMLFQGGMLLVQMYLAKLPTLQTDAHGVANSLFMLYYVFAYSLSSITATVCGQCVGARDKELTRRYCKSFIFVGRFVMLAAVAVLLPLTSVIVKLYSTSAGALPIIYRAVLVGALPMPLIWCDAFSTAAATRAAGDSVFTTVISLTGLAIGRMACGYLFTITLGMGVVGVWLGQLVEWIFRAIILRLRLRGGRWYRVMP